MYKEKLFAALNTIPYKAEEKKHKEMEICESQKTWKANQSHNVEENHFFFKFNVAE